MAWIEFGFARSACSYDTIASSRLPKSSARLPNEMVSMHSHDCSNGIVSYLSASTPARSSQPFAGRRATVDVAVPSQVAEDHREDHGAVACLPEKMDDGQPSCEINAQFEI